MRVASRAQYDCKPLQEAFWKFQSNFVLKGLWFIDSVQHHHAIYPFVPGRLPEIDCPQSVSVARFYLSEILLALEFLAKQGVYYTYASLLHGLVLCCVMQIAHFLTRCCSSLCTDSVLLDASGKVFILFSPQRLCFVSFTKKKTMCLKFSFFKAMFCFVRLWSLFRTLKIHGRFPVSNRLRQS